MKKLVVFALLLALALSLCACTDSNVQGSGETTSPSLTGSIQAGYAIVKITPDTSVPLSGFGNSHTRMSTNVLSDLYATCLALTDESGKTVLLITMDLQQTYDEEVLNIARPAISQATGVPEDHIVLSASHTHSGPDLQSSATAAYRAKLNKIWLPQVAKAAMDDRMEAQLSYGSIETEGLNFVKHYYNVDASGNKQYFGDNFGTVVLDETTQHATQIDPTLHLVQFTREGGKDIVLANWRAHPCLTGSSIKTDISADYVGAFRKSLEKMYDCQFIYFQGAAGNVNASSRITSENLTQSYSKHGEYLATYALKCLRNNMTPADSGAIQVSQTILEPEYVKVSDAMYTKALQVKAYFESTNDREGAVKLGEPHGIRSPYHANALVRLHNKAKPTGTVELNAISIGNAISFVTAPNELFDANSAWLEENSPYAMTLTLGYANGYWGYIPSQEGFEYTSYESDVCNFNPGIGETIQENFLRMLNAMAGKS